MPLLPLPHLLNGQTEVTFIAFNDYSHAGLLARGSVCATVTNKPLKLPEAPTPAIARPTIKAADVCADPHTADPISKTTTEAMKTHLMGKRLYSFPKRS